MSNHERDLRIKQLIPIPECLTPIQYFPDAKCYADVSGTVFYALLENQKDESIHFYSIDCLGAGDFDDSEIQLERTVNCKNCGQRMVIEDIPFDDGGPGILCVDMTYKCPCGTKCIKRNRASVAIKACDKYEWIEC